MCIMCGQAGMQHNNVAVPSVPPRTRFKDLRFSEEEYGRLSAARRSGTFLSSPSTVDEDSPKVRVTGTSDDVKALLNIASGHAERCWIEVPFSTMDSLLWVMERVEKVIRVPMKYWTLAGDGVIYNPGHLVASLDHFRQPGTIEVVLLPVWEIGRYAEENLKSHTWKHAPVTPPAALPKDPREQVMALFGLIDPVESPDWAAYIKHRQEAEKVTNELMEGMAGADMDPFVSQLREVVQDVAEAVNPLMDDDWKKIADSVSVIRCVPEDDGWGRLRDVEVLSRIHSLASPQSVDVYFYFHHRTRMDSVEWKYSLAFRVNTKPVKCTRCYNGDGDLEVDKAQRAAGWRTFGWFYLDNRRAEHSRCAVTGADLQAVHDALFGPDNQGRDDEKDEGAEKEEADEDDDTLGSGIGLRETALLMLACVGIRLDVAEEEGDDDGYSRSFGRELALNLDSEKPGISAAHLRKICGMDPLPGDDRADLSREQVTAPIDSDEDESGGSFGRRGRSQRDDECVAC